MSAHVSVVPALSYLSLLLLAGPASARQCETSFSVCKEVKSGDLVFIGTVESIEPIFLNRWNRIDQSQMQRLNNTYTDAQHNPSAGALAQLKDVSIKMFPGLAADEKTRLENARTTDDIAALFFSSLDRGMRVRFKVKTLFKHEDNDDDSPKNTGAKDTRGKDDDRNDSAKGKSNARPKAEQDFIDVWTMTGDCGYDFQIGETYLVYAFNDEFSDYLFTSSCTRTRRVSDAGDDLAYLFFFKDHPEESSRLEGFTTADTLSPLDFDYLHDPESVKSPVAGVIVKLESDRLVRFAQADGNGRFIFDGLPEGDYRVSAFGSTYPVNPQLLAGPHPIHIQAKSCARQILRLPK